MRESLYFDSHMRGDGSVHYIMRSGDLILYLGGEVTASLAQALFERVRSEVRSGRIQNVVVEMSRAEYLDSTSVGTLIKLKSLLEEGGGNLVICNLQKKVRGILSDMHLVQYFRPVEAEPEATGNRSFLAEIKPLSKDLMSSDYLLDAHESIVQAAPHLEDQFRGLIRVLKTQSGQSEE